jgi:hypothetical protein
MLFPHAEDRIRSTEQHNPAVFSLYLDVVERLTYDLFAVSVDHLVRWHRSALLIGVGTSLRIMYLALFARQQHLRMRQSRHSANTEEDLVHVTPPPVLARLERPHHRMIVIRFPVRGGVPIRRVVATADVPAAHAQAKMHPPAAYLQTVLAPVARRCDVFDGIEVRAGLTHNVVLTRWRPGYSAERAAFDDDFAKSTLEDRKLLVVQLLDEELLDRAQMNRRGLG